MTDLVSDDEGADLSDKDVPSEAAQQASMSTLEKQAPGPEDIAMADGEPAAIQCVYPPWTKLHKICSTHVCNERAISVETT